MVSLRFMVASYALWSCVVTEKIVHVLKFPCSIDDPPTDYHPPLAPRPQLSPKPKIVPRHSLGSMRGAGQQESSSSSIESLTSGSSRATGGGGGGLEGSSSGAVMHGVSPLAAPRTSLTASASAPPTATGETLWESRETHALLKNLAQLGSSS